MAQPWGSAPSDLEDGIRVRGQDMGARGQQEGEKPVGEGEEVTKKPQEERLGQSRGGRSSPGRRWRGEGCSQPDMESVTVLPIISGGVTSFLFV